MKKKHSFFKRNGLSIVLIILMIMSLLGQIITGYNVHNDELMEHGIESITMSQYLSSGHFIQATFENWESEFLQMALYVMLTIKLYQVGSSESKDPEKVEKVDKPVEIKKDSPWPVKKGGLWLSLYSISLSMAFVLLFIVSFLFHFYGSLKRYNEEQFLKGLETESWKEYLGNSEFWFESFQNWQSEFLAVISIVLLSIWLRQKGSPESKPVDAAYTDTGN